MLNYEIVDINSKNLKTSDALNRSVLYLKTKNPENPKKEYALTNVNPNTIYDMIVNFIREGDTSVYNLCRTLRPIYQKFLMNKDINGLSFEDSLRGLKKFNPAKIEMINHCMDLLGCKKLIMDENGNEINPNKPDFEEKLESTDKIFVEAYKNGVSHKLNLTPQIALDLIAGKIESDPLSCVTLCDTLSPFYNKFLSNGDFVNSLEELKLKKPLVQDEINLCLKTLKVPENVNVNNGIKEKVKETDSPIKSDAKDYFNEIKNLFESYDIKQDGENINLIDRKTGKVIDNNFKEFTTAVQFAHSWVASAGYNLSFSGKTNEFGIDENQFDCAFNEGARQTFEMIMKEYDPQNVDIESFANSIKEKTGYKYADSLIQGLLLNPQGQEKLNPEFENNFPFKEPWQKACIDRQLKIYSTIIRSTTNEESLKQEKDPSERFVEASRAHAERAEEERRARAEIQKEERKKFTYEDVLEEARKKEERKEKEREEARIKHEEWEKRVAENEKNNAEIYRHMIIGSTLKGHMYNLEHYMPNPLNEKMKSVSPKIKNAIYQTAGIMVTGTDLEIVGSSGKSKNLAILIGELWDKEPSEAIADIDNYLSNSEVPADVKKIFESFKITKQSISPNLLNSVATSYKRRSEVYEDWKKTFLIHTSSMDNPKEVYEYIKNTPGVETGYFANKIQEDISTSSIRIPCGEAWHNKDFVGDLLVATKNLEQDGMEQN